MESPLNCPTPSYPTNYVHVAASSTPSTSQDSPSRNSGLSLPGLGNKRNSSFLSLASLNLAHSSSSLLGIFSSALDSVPPTPIPTPPIEIRQGKALIEELDRWKFIRDST